MLCSRIRGTGIAPTLPRCLLTPGKLFVDVLPATHSQAPGSPPLHPGGASHRFWLLALALLLPAAAATLVGRSAWRRHIGRMLAGFRARSHLLPLEQQALIGRHERSSPPDSGSVAEALQAEFPLLNRRVRQARLLQEAQQAGGTAIEMVPLPALQQAVAHRFAAEGEYVAEPLLPAGRCASTSSLARYSDPAGSGPAAPKEARWKLDTESLRIQPEALEVCGGWAVCQAVRRAGSLL